MAEELERIRDGIEGLRASQDSMQKSINSNMTDILQRLTALEREFKGHVALNDQKHTSLEKELAAQAAIVAVLEQERQQRKGIIWLLSFAGVGELIHIASSLLGK